MELGLLGGFSEKHLNSCWLGSFSTDPPTQARFAARGVPGMTQGLRLESGQDIR